MTAYTNHRLHGIEPDNLLAFMALLGLLRALQEVRPEWSVRAYWTVDDPPLRAALRTPDTIDEDAILTAASEGLNLLAELHNFDSRDDLKFAPEEVRSVLQRAINDDSQNPYVADLWSAIICDAALTKGGDKADPTPLCFMFGQGHQHFLQRLASVPRKKVPERGKGRNKLTVSEVDSLRDSLFALWLRPDSTPSFRWDPNEDVRYALRSHNPIDPKMKETTQHGANRLAAIGFSTLTVVPMPYRGTIRATMLGSNRDANGQLTFRWPIWRDPISLVCIRSLLSHPGLARKDTLDALGIVEVRQAQRISVGKFMNVTWATPKVPPAL